MGQRGKTGNNKRYNHAEGDKERKPKERKESDKQNVNQKGRKEGRKYTRQEGTKSCHARSS